MTPRSSQHLAPPSNLEVALVTIALAVSPFWFLHLPSISLGPSGLLATAALVFYGVRTQSIPVAPSRGHLLATSCFLLAAALSLAVSIRPLEGLLNYFQYFFIFLVAVPVSAHAFRNRRHRRLALACLWGTLNLLAVWAAFHALSTGSTLRATELAYGNQNQLYWLVASGTLLNLGVVLDSTARLSLRLTAAAALILTAVLTIGGVTLSAILMLAAGGWLLGLWVLFQRQYSRLAITYLCGTVVAAVTLGALAVEHWEWIYVQGSLASRTRQYQAAVTYGLQSFPLGIGLESSDVLLAEIPALNFPSIHNYFLAYFLEIGILGAVAFTGILGEWVRMVLVTAFQRTADVTAFEMAAIAVFAAGILVMLVQPVPVRRYWWLLFGLTYAVATDSSANTATESRL